MGEPSNLARRSPQRIHHRVPRSLVDSRYRYAISPYRRVEHSALRYVYYLGVGLTSLGFSPEEVTRAFVFYGCGANVGVLIGGRMADRLGSKVTSRISLAGLCVCFLVLWLALRAGVLVDLAFRLASAVAQLFFPAQQVGLASDFPARRATVLAWNNSALLGFRSAH
jgi:predicted MFS family arabinose efflux permease